MSQRTTGTRAAALRKAREAKAAHDAERLRREAQIEQALADFYEASGRSAQIRDAARQRADKVIAAAHQHARRADEDAGRAVRTLRALGETNAQIAQLCQLTVAAVRSMANDTTDKPATEDRPAAGEGGDRTAGRGVMTMSAGTPAQPGAGDDGGAHDGAAPVTRV